MRPRELKLVYGFGDFVAIMEPFVEYGAEFVRLYKEFICLLPKPLKLIIARVSGSIWLIMRNSGATVCTSLLRLLNFRNMVL